MGSDYNSEDDKEEYKAVFAVFKDGEFSSAASSLGVSAVRACLTDFDS